MKSDLSILTFNQDSYTKLDKYKMMRPCKIILTDLKYEKSVRFDGKRYIVNDERRKNHSCYICMVKFSTVADLNFHKHLHNESEDDFFEEEFVTNSARVSNKENSIGIIDEKVKNMDVLIKVNDKTSSSSMIDLISDKKLEVTSKLPDKMKPPFRCDVCEVYFETSDDAKKHLVTNSKCKFSCRLCNRKFNTLYAFVVHVMQHKNNIVKNQLNSNTLYNCSTCNKSFSECDQLRSHIILTHKRKTNNQLVVPQSSPILLKTRECTEQIGEATAVDEQAEKEFICELCYDICKSKEELDSHTDFHKQIERLSEPVVMDDSEATVEVIDDYRDKHEIVTTIQKASPNTSVSKTNTATMVYDTFSLAPIVLSPSTVPKQKLTAKIKEMITPKSITADTKQNSSKTIFLPNIEPKTKGKKVNKQKQENNTKRSTETKIVALEIQRTSSTSFSVVYKDKDDRNVSESQNVTASDTVLPKQLRKKNVKYNEIINMPSNTSNKSDSNLIPNTIPLTSSSAIPVNNVSSSFGYILNPSIPSYSTAIQQANSIGTFSSNIVTNFASPLPSTSTYGYVIIPNSISSIASTSTLATTSANDSGLLPIVSEDLLEKPQEIDPPISDIKMPVIYNVMSLKDSSKSDLISSSETNAAETMTSVATASLDPLTTSITKCSKISNMGPSEVADPNEIICIDSDSEEPVRPSDSDEGDLVIDDSANQDDFEYSDTSSKNTESEPRNTKKAKKYRFSFKCDSCCTVFRRNRALRHHNQRKHSCRICNFKCCKISEMVKHYLLEHRLYYCWRCSCLKQSEEEFEIHLKCHTCPVCSNVYTKLENHILCRKAKRKSSTISELPIALE